MVLLYSKKKLKISDRQLLQCELKELMFTHGSSLEYLAPSDSLNEIYLQSIVCTEQIQTLYNSAGYDSVLVSIVHLLFIWEHTFSSIFHSALTVRCSKYEENILINTPSN